MPPPEDRGGNSVAENAASLRPLAWMSFYLVLFPDVTEWTSEKAVQATGFALAALESTTLLHTSLSRIFTSHEIASPV